MREAIVQSFENLRANKLRSLLTMFGILWGMISIVLLSAMGEGFQRGNQKVLLELGKNIGIIWGGRTSLQAGGIRAGRQIFLTIDDARAIAATLPRSYEALVHDQVRFRVGRIVYAAFSDDDRIMGFAFPRDEREALVASDPDKFLMPRPSDMRYRWVCVRLDAIDVTELRELLVDAWRMCVPKKVAAAYEG